jgi:hypothetical protein
MRVRGTAAGGTFAAVEADSLTQVAALLRERNAIDVKLAQIISRPMISGHLGEWIAAHVFDIELESISGRRRHRWLFPLRSIAGPERQHQVVPEARRLARHDGVHGARLLSGSYRTEVISNVFARHHPAVVHPSRVSVRGAATSV